MIPIKKIISGIVTVAGILTCSVSVISAETPIDSSALKQMLDSLGLNESDLEGKVRSTLLFGGSAPVSFSGEARIRLQFHNMDEPPAYIQNDKTYLSQGWEGNESAFRLGMVARAGRNAILYSKLGFQNTLPGTYEKKYDYSDTSEQVRDTTTAQLTHKDGSPVIIHEDMAAGLALRTKNASFMLKMGGLIWTEMSPLTVWKSQPRTFAWEYLPFEVEQPIGRYYEYNIAKGEKSGRAAWNKKPFQGINIESINLPGNLYFNFLYGTYERYDNCEREYVDYSNDIAYAGETNESKGLGIGDSYRHVLLGKIGVNELLGRLTPSVDFARYTYDEDVKNNRLFKSVFQFFKPGSKAFYKDHFTSSIDLRGYISDKFRIHGNFAINRVDTNWLFKEVDTNVINNVNRFDTVVRKSHSKTGINPALFLRLESKYGLPISADIAVISKGFYSPKSFVAPVDAFFPFGANLCGPGAFIAQAEASPYAKNMAGVNLQVVPNLPGYGHLKVTYGQHFQLESAQDVIFFPYRLNGQDLFSLFHSSYSRWGNDAVDHCFSDVTINNGGGQTKYQYRLGDEGFLRFGDKFPRGMMAGGLKTTYLSSYESFVPYSDKEMADSNYNIVKRKNKYDSAAAALIYTPGTYVPKHRKFTYNLEFDGSYDIGPLVHYPRDFFMSLYAAINGVSTALKPLAFNEKADDMLLWGTYLRFEPAIAVTGKFYILGLAGFENWKTGKTYMYLDSVKGSPVTSQYIEENLGTAARDQFVNEGTRLFNVPINYRDYALGIGFDWDMLARVGLHGRIKWMKHDDVNFKSNSWETPVIAAEIKMWF